MAVWERDTLAYWFARIMPEQATDEALLVEASEYADTEVRKQFPQFREAVARTSDFGVKKSQLARMVADEGLRIRNEWLKEHGALRG